MNGSHHRVLGAEDFRAQDSKGHALYETCMAKAVPYLMAKFGSQLDDADRESIAAGAFLTAYRKGIAPDGEPVAYVKKIAYNDAVEYLKKSPRTVPDDPTDPTGLLSTFAENPANAADPADTSDDENMDADEAAGRRDREDADVWDLVDPAIGDIGAAQRREVIRRQSRGQHDQQIAAELRIPPNQVYQQRSRGTADLRTALEPYIRPNGRPPTATGPGE